MDNSKADGISAGIWMLAGSIVVPFIAVFVAVSIIIDAYVLYVLWGWFATPLGAPAITMAHAAGLRLMAAAIQAPNKGHSNSENPWLSILLELTLRPAILLFIGWVIKTNYM